MRKSMMTAGAVTLGAGARAFGSSSGGLTPGDAAILKLLAAAEIIESDLWQQYNELGGIQDNEVPGGSGSKPYTDALNNLDSDMAQYIHDNTNDEFSHFTLIWIRCNSRRRCRTSRRGSTPPNREQMPI